jgi:hypothetical protein
MDYARYNYVAQPGDKNIRFVRQLGPYDDYSVEWGYRYFGQDPKKEQEILKQMVDAKSLNPVYMFGGYGNDPNSQTENIGDDPVKASKYGIKNLKVVAKNLIGWTVESTGNYGDLGEIYGELIGVYRRYIYHVHSLVGGVYNTPHNFNQKGVTTYENVDFTIQNEALKFLESNLWQTQKWLMETELISQIRDEGILNVMQSLQTNALNRFMNTDKLNRMLSSQETLMGEALTVEQLLDNLFSVLISKKPEPDFYEQRLQLHFMERINILNEEEKLNPVIKGLLLDLKKKIKTFASVRSVLSNEESRAHFKYLKEISKKNNI